MNEDGTILPLDEALAPERIETLIDDWCEKEGYELVKRTSEGVRAKAIQLLRTQAKRDDTHYAHIEADSIICALLVTLGCQDVVDAYHKVRKFYS